MNAKEKALELILFFDKIQIDSDKNIAYTFYHLGIDDRKKMALKVIDEILEEMGRLNIVNRFWEQVKKEIELL
jgi:hypothetical protein